MQAGSEMMGGMVPQIAGQDVVPAMGDIVRGGIFVILGTAGMVIISVATGHYEADQHRNDENRDSVESVDPDKQRQDRNMDDAHDHKDAMNGCVFRAVSEGMEIA